MLALDLATTTGWAHSCGDSGVQRFDWSEKHAGQRWDEFKGWLQFMLRKYPDLDAVVYEAALHQKGMAARVANSLVTIVEHECHLRGLMDRGFHLSTIKKHATGSGRADKVAMWEAAKDRGITFTPETDDVVDALWLLDLALCNLPAGSGGACVGEEGE